MLPCSAGIRLVDARPLAWATEGVVVVVVIVVTTLALALLQSLSALALPKGRWTHVASTLGLED